ncbi:MAG: biopolymer transporter ExbD [Spirochaetales bacterium]|nr:biopolymer transporter ExbD [Spirochaetales bacterium]
MKVNTGYEDKRINIELIALIDVVFLLLVFFIYAMLSMAVQKSLGVNLPRAQGISRQQGIIITLTHQGQFFLDGESFELEQLVPAVSRRHKQSNLPVHIQGDRNAGLGPAVELLAELRAQGVEQVFFQVQDRKDGE